MKIDSKTITCLTDDIEGNTRIYELLTENNIQYTMGSASTRNIRTIGPTTAMTMDFFTVYKFESENDAVEFKLRYM